MTVINFAGFEDSLNLPVPLEFGRVSATRWRGNSPAATADGPKVVFPKQITIKVKNGVPETPIDLPPTDATYCIRWDITGYVDIGSGKQALSWVRHTSVPDAPSVDFADLVDVDPKTYMPGENLSAWTDTLKHVTRLMSEGADINSEAKAAASDANRFAVDAETYKDLAEDASDRAAMSALQAETSRDEAEAARNLMPINPQVVGDNLVFDTLGGSPIIAGVVRGPAGEKGDKGDQGPVGSLATYHSKAELDAVRSAEVGILVSTDYVADTGISDFGALTGDLLVITSPSTLGADGTGTYYITQYLYIEGAIFARTMGDSGGGAYITPFQRISLDASQPSPPPNTVYLTGKTEDREEWGVVDGRVDPSQKSLMLRDAQGRSQVADPLVSEDVATKGYVDTAINTVGASTFARVEAVTGDEPRPNSSFVIWIGGTTQPSGMIDGDIWYKVVGPEAPVEPETPTGYTIFGTQSMNQMPGVWNSDGENLWAMNGFVTREATGVDITGVRFWMPEGADMEMDVAVRAYRVPYPGAMVTAESVFTSPILATGSKTSTHQVGWNEVALSAPVHADPLVSDWWNTPGGSFIGLAIRFGAGVNYVNGFNWNSATLDSTVRPGTMLLSSERGGGGYSGFGTYANGSWYYGLDAIFEVS